MYYNFAAGSFLSKKLCSRLHSIEVDFYSKNRQIGDFDPHLGELATTDDLRWWLVGKRVGNLLFVIIELFLLARTVETLQAEICRRERFSKAGGSLPSPILGGKGRRPKTTVGWQKTRWIALSYGTKISPVGSLVSHKARVWRTDRRTDRITTPKTALA